MNSLARAVALAMLGVQGLFAIAQQGPVPIQNGFLTGNSYRELPEYARIGYVTGWLDAIYLSPLVGAPKRNLTWLEACAKEMTNHQLAAVIEKWLAENPVRWHEPMNFLAFIAMQEACRLPQSGSKK